MKNGLIIFIKNPVLGTVKTRLAAELGDERALKIYLQLIRHTREVALSLSARRYLFYAQYIDHQDDWLPEHFVKEVQPKGDLGHRMEMAFEKVLKEQEKAVIIGSDCASLSPGIVEEAFSVLDQHDVVIGPALDGGYYLLGMKALHPPLFRDMTWSNERVYSETINRIKAGNLSYGTVATLSDIDYAADWEKYGWKE